MYGAALASHIISSSGPQLKGTRLHALRHLAQRALALVVLTW